MYRFLASRRWAVRIIAGLLLVAACIRLGIWQLDRNDERSERNGRIEAAEDATPAAIGDVLDDGQPLDDSDQWRPVEITGRYDVDNQFVVQLRPLDGQRGVHVLTPLVTASGEALLVDRGFLPTSDVDAGAAAAPDPSTTDVTVVARLKPSEAGRGAGGDLGAGQVRYVDVEAIGEKLQYPLYQAWGELVSQQPAASDQLTLVPPPETDAGPHLSYAIQWFIFATIGLGGFVMLVRAEARGHRELARERGEPQQSSSAAA